MLFQTISKEQLDVLKGPITLQLTPEQYLLLESAVQRASELLGEAIEYTPHGDFYEQETAPLQDEIDRIGDLELLLRQQVSEQIQAVIP